MRCLITIRKRKQNQSSLWEMPYSLLHFKDWGADQCKELCNLFHCQCPPTITTFYFERPAA